MKPKKYAEVTYIPNTLIRNFERDNKILIIVIILISLLTMYVCLRGMKIATKYEALKIENNELNKVVEMQKSIISDLQEDNMKLQEMIDNGK